MKACLPYLSPRPWRGSFGRRLRALAVAMIALQLAWSLERPLSAADAFTIRGTLPWHNFLSGPTAWNEDDYVRYLDRMKALRLNYVAFHCYTGGAERYAPYVEPLLRMEYREVVPLAGFDTSLTARWGYRPLPVSEFAFGTDRLFTLPGRAKAFGADCAVLAQNNEDRYSRAQDLTRCVIAHAHERGIQVGIGFEFGIHPPEFASIVPPGSVIRGAMLPDPTHPASIEILRATLGNLLQAYPGVDWVWLWLHEHTMYVGKPQLSGTLREFLERNRQFFGNVSEETLFTGIWSLAYIREAHHYLRERAPAVRLAISGWGGGTQLPDLLRGLDRALPREIVFSCLNPNQGWSPQPTVLAEIAEHRETWAIPWLEGDARLWHLQPRVSLLREQVQLATQQKLQGVLAIHWRTEETRANLEAFADFAGDPDHAPTAEEFYRRDCETQFGPNAAVAIAHKLIDYDRRQLIAAASPEYFPYDPSWARLESPLRSRLANDAAEVATLTARETDKQHRANLDWLAANLEFTLLLDDVSRALEPAFRLKDRWLRGEADIGTQRQEWVAASASLDRAPVEKLFQTFARRVRSKGELGELSALNQKLWLQYRELRQFLARAQTNIGRANPPGR